MILSVWPALLSYSMFGTFLLRLGLGLLWLRFGYQTIFKPAGADKRLKLWGGLMLATGLLLTLGLWTQVAALVAALLAVLALRRRLPSEPTLAPHSEFYFLTLIVALALLTLGPGVFALDLPL